MRGELPRAHAHRARLLRREHQPRRGVGHRHAECAQGAAQGAARADGAPAASAEAAGDYTARLALLEEFRTLPFGPVWDAFCEQSGVPVAEAWIADVKRYEADVLSVAGEHQSR